MEAPTGGQQLCVFLLRGAGEEEERRKEVGCQWESPEEHRKEVGCQSEVAERRDASVQVDLPTQQLTWRHSGRPDPGPANTANVSAEEKLTSVRSQFIDRVSEPVLRKLLDKLLERCVIIDDEMDLGGAKSRADKARQVIDVVRGKGSSASSALIDALCDVDRCLAEQLKLM